MTVSSSERGHRAGRYLLTVPWDLHHIGGVNQVVANLARELAAADGVDPIILTTAFGHYDPKWETTDLNVPLVRMTLLNPRSESRPIVSLIKYLLRFPSMLLRMRRLLREQHVETVNVHFPTLATLVPAIAVKLLGRGRRLILSFHGVDIQRISEAPWAWRLIARGIVAAADALVFCSSALQQEFEKALPNTSVRKEVIHNGIDAQRVSAASHSGAVPDALAGGRFVLNAATFEHKKGQDVLVSAFALIADKYPDVSLVLMGRDGPAFADVQQVVTSHALESRVILLCDVPHEDLLASMSAATAFALPSRIEPFGIVILEAAVFSKPVVASRTGGIVEIIENEELGHLVPPGDPDSLARALDQVLDRTEESSRMAAALNERVLREFSWKHAARRYLSIGGRSE